MKASQGTGIVGKCEQELVDVRRLALDTNTRFSFGRALTLMASQTPRRLAFKRTEYFLIGVRCRPTKTMLTTLSLQNFPSPLSPKRQESLLAPECCIDQFLQGVAQYSLMNPRPMLTRACSFRAASSSSSPSPPVPSSSAPPKKLGLISWIRSEIGENLLGEPVSPQQLADAKQAALYQSGSLFDRAENELLSKARDDVKRRLERHFRGKQVPEIPQGLGLRGLMKWEKKTMQPRPTEVGF